MNPQQFNFLGNNTLQNFQNNTGGMINQTSNESEKFPWLTKQQETEIMNKANQANVTESQKNYMLNDMYQQQLRRNQIDKFAEERENTKRQLIRRAVESKDIKTSKQSKQIEKKWDVADMIRKYVSATQEIDLNKLNKVPDDQIIADFTADNPDVAYAIDDFTKSQMSSQYFSEMMGFSQFEEQQDEWFFKNLLNSITYGVETWAKWLKWLIDKWLDTVEWNSNESSYSMENLTAFDNYIQHKYWVSGSQLRESDKEVWQQERNLVQDNPEVLKQYMTTASEDALNFAEWYTDALFTATNPYMALGMKTVWAAEQEMWGGVLTWLAEKMGWVWEIINSIPWLSNYRDTLSPEDQQRFDAFVGNVAVGLILWTKNKKNIIKDPKTFLMENLQPNQITKNFVQSVTWMPDRLLWGTDSLAGGAKWLMSKATKWVDNAGNVIDRAAEWGAKKITWTATAQDKLYKAQEPRMNILSEKKNLERRRANSDRANELILDNGYKPTNTSERLDAHQKTLNKLWGQVMEKVNAQEWVNVDQSSMITALSDYIKSKKKLWVAWISSDIKALEAELKSLKKMQAEWNTDIPTLEAKKQVLNDLIDRKGQEASEVYKWGIKLLTQEIWKIEDSIISQIPWEFSELKRDVGALLDSYEDVFKADMKNQRKKWLGLTETYSRIEWIGDTLWGIVKLFWGDASGLVKWLWKLALGKSLAKASDVDFLIKQWFEDLANEKGLDKSQATSKTAKYQVAYHGSKADFDRFDSSHMWEWEWAQAHWWGHYIAANEQTGRHYASFWEPKYEYDWVSLDEYRKNHQYTPFTERDAKSIAEEMAINDIRLNWNLDLNELKEEVRVAIHNSSYEWQRDKYIEVLKALDDIDESKVKKVPWRHLYEVEIPDPVKKDTPTGSNFIEESWKLTLEQRKDLIARLRDVNKDSNHFQLWVNYLENKLYGAQFKWDDTWKDVYKYLSDGLLDNPKEASKALEALWYDGIHYFWWRDWEAWVIFNDDAIKINKHDKYQKYWTAWRNEKWISATEWLNIRNFKNWKTVQELANQYWIDTKIVDSISTPEWQRAYWMYWDRLITLSKDLKESTVPHELLHGVFDMVDSKKRTSILEWIQKKLNVDEIQAEEWLADNFSEYYRTGKFDVKGIPTTFAGKVKQFFQQIKEYIDGTYANRKEIQNLFNDIIDWKIEWEYWVYSDPKFQSVWHGSPADFERFDSTHMGEWEWAQAHGWGHYVAKEERTWRHYAELKEKASLPYEYDWKLYRDIVREENTSSDMYTRRKLWEITSLIWEMAESDWSKTFKELLDTRKKFINKVLQNDMETLAKKSKWEEQYVIDNLNQFIENDKELLWILDEIDVDKIKEVDLPKNRNLYEVEIPDPIKKNTPTWSNYFEEDGVYGRNELDKIIKALEDYEPIKEIEKWEDLPRWNNINEDQVKRNAMAWLKSEELDWNDVYATLSNYLWWDKQASKFLESLGYDGIHYYGWRDWEAYVIFNDDALQITKHHKY